MVESFQVISDKFTIKKIYTNGNYAHKWIINCVSINLQFLLAW